MKQESKIGKIDAADQKIYEFLTNFNNFKNLIPEDKVKDWESDEDSCSFSIDPLGKTGFRIVEKAPYNLIKLTSAEKTQYDFLFWIQLKQLGPEQTAVKLTIDVKLNAMMQMMAKKPIQNFLDTLVDQLGKMNFDQVEKK